MSSSVDGLEKQSAAADSRLNFSAARRLPLILQSESAECGLACIAMVAGFHGYQADLSSLRRRFSISNQGATLRDLIAIANQLHLSSRALRTEIDGIQQVTMPCIIHWGLNHFVVLKSASTSKFVIHDPAFGEKTLSANEFGLKFTGVALELIPTYEFEEKDERQKLKFSDFWTKIVGLKRNLIQVVALSILLQLFALISPLFMQITVDDVLLKNDSNLLLVLALGFGLLMLIQIGTTALREFVVLHFSNRLGLQMSANMFRQLIRLPMDYFSKRHMGDIVSRFGSLNYVRQMLTSGMVAAVVDGIMAIITLAAMMFYNVKMASIVLGFVVIYVLLRWALYRPFRLLNEEAIVAAAKENSHFMESVRAIQTVKLFQKENDRQNQWQNALVESMNKNIHISRWQIGYNAIRGFLFGAENILVIYVAATAVMGNLISLGMLYAFMAYKLRFVASAERLVEQWIQFRVLDLHFSRLADIAHTKAEVVEDPYCLADARSINQHEQGKESQIVGKIEVKNLSYRYSAGEDYVFSDLNFTIEAGETVAITGPSGCGKTTLLKCLMGLIEPTKGQILIDDTPLKDIPGYRRQIASVMQEDKLITGDIAENICCFDAEIHMGKIKYFANMACVLGDILKLPMQFHSLVGDMGSTLSSGQKQRIVLARALYRKPRILFMDEATSHLDVKKESIVNRNISRFHMTRILVAHRPETVASAGRQIDLT